jgi:hypothetical protein
MQWRHHPIGSWNCTYQLVLKKVALIDCVHVANNEQKMGFSFFQVALRLFGEEELLCLQWISALSQVRILREML